MTEKTYTIDEISQLLGVPCSEIMNAISNGLLDVCKQGNLCLVPIEALKRYIS